MPRIAAVGDLHFSPDAAGSLRPHLLSLKGSVDALLLAGDLTRHGEPAEAQSLAAELAGIGVPIVAVLGNHDHEADRTEELCGVLAASGIRVLDGDGVVLDVGRWRLGVAGVKGFGGGFAGACVGEFGEPEMKAFARHGREAAQRLEAALRGLNADVRIGLLHYAPVATTLLGERPELYPFLGNFRLAEAVDRGGAALALHGHAHLGRECGATPGGVAVRNVARPVIRGAYAVYSLGPDGSRA